MGHKFTNVTRQLLNKNVILRPSYLPFSIKTFMLTKCMFYYFLSICTLLKIGFPRFVKNGLHLSPQAGIHSHSVNTYT